MQNALPQITVEREGEKQLKVTVIRTGTALRHFPIFLVVLENKLITDPLSTHQMDKVTTYKAAPVIRKVNSFIFLNEENSH